MKTPPRTLAEALAVIEPTRSDFAYLPLTLARLYLMEGDPMPPELRVWLAAYLNDERRRIEGWKGRLRSLQMANFAVDERNEEAADRETGRRVPPKPLREQFAEQMKIDEKTVRNWQKDPRYHATRIVSEHLDGMLSGPTGIVARIMARQGDGKK